MNASSLNMWGNFSTDMITTKSTIFSNVTTDIASFDNYSTEILTNTFSNVITDIASYDNFSTTIFSNVTTVTDIASSDIVSTEIQDDFNYSQVTKNMNKAVEILNVYLTPIVYLFGLTGNILTMLVVAKDKSPTSTGVYMGVLAAADLVVLLTNGSMWVCFQTVGLDLLDLHWSTCSILYFVMLFALHLSVNTLAAMTGERYVIVRFPLQAKDLCTRNKAKITVAIVGIIVIGLNAPNLFLRMLVQDSDGNIICITETVTLHDGTIIPHAFWHLKVFPWIDAMLYSFIPLIVIFILNVLIVHQLKVMRKTREEMGQHQNNDQDKQITRMLLVVSFSFLILTTPMAVILIAGKYIEVPTGSVEEAILNLLRTVSYLLQSLNHSINFFLYTVSANKFRQQFLSLVCPCRQTGTRNNSTLALSSDGGTLSTATNKSTK